MNQLLRPNAIAISMALIAITGCASSDGGERFTRPEDAILELRVCLADENGAQYDAIFGVGASESLRSGDPVADRADAARVSAMIDERVAFDFLDETTAIALLGRDEWPFAIPLVLRDGKWAFDLEKGKEEIANRRVGRNELLTIAALREIVAAQREYQAVRHDGNPPTYARKLMSDPGKQNGLYWESKPGEPPSPMGEFVARATRDGYSAPRGEPTPFHGYYYRLLTKQGPDAPGGERNYEDESGLLTGGFAAIAWPATPGVSGVMTFLVSDRGIVFEKSLGDDTAAIVAKIESYDPDESWSPVIETP